MATPHLRPDFPNVHVHELAVRCREVREAIDRAEIPIRLVEGAEVSVMWAVEVPDDELKLASYGQRGTDLLIETPNMPLVGFERFIKRLQDKGYRITLGHPERNAQFRRDDGFLRGLRAHGVLLQVNAESILGSGRRGGVRPFARYLLTEGLAHAIASDGHRGDSWRPVTSLADAAQAAAELVGRERAQWMTEIVPAAIVEGAEIPVAPAATQQRKRRLFGR